MSAQDRALRIARITELAGEPLSPMLAKADTALVFAALHGTGTPPEHPAES